MDGMMNVSNKFTQNRATLKLLFVGLLSLAMSIPLLFVRSIISERQDLQFSAEQTITGRWGGAQSIGGLVAIMNSPAVHTDTRSIEKRWLWRANVLWDLAISAELNTEWRYLGIYQVPVYTTQLHIEGRIDRATLDNLQPEGDLIFWLPVGDVRGVREVSSLKLGALEIPARPMTVMPDKYSGLQFTLPSAERDRLEDTYSLEIKLAGSQSFQFLPLADNTRVNIEADWAHPEFIGQFLPAGRNIDEQGFEANWQLTSLNRPYGDQWLMSEMSDHQLKAAGFGLRLETPVDGYQRSERSVKYGFLFIALTFFTLFLMEILTARPLHPVPYILTGAALAVFYLVLLALSEYLSFSRSFVIAAGLLVLIITPYAGTVLGGLSRGYLVGTMMSLTYALLYVLVSAQHLALLLGSLTLLVAISLLMYLTRNVDWYHYDNGES